MDRVVDRVTSVFTCLMSLHWFMPFESAGTGWDEKAFRGATFNFIYVEPIIALGIRKVSVRLVMVPFTFGDFLHSRAMVPAMTKEGYVPGFAAASFAVGELLAQVIPPSMLFAIYGVRAQLSIGDLFIAGITQGLIQILAFFVVISATRLVRQFPNGDWMTLPDALRTLGNALPAFFIPLACILLGIATQTEGAVIASLIAFAIGRSIARSSRAISSRCSCAPRPIPRQ